MRSAATGAAQADSAMRSPATGAAQAGLGDALGGGEVDGHELADALLGHGDAEQADHAGHRHRVCVMIRERVLVRLVIFVVIELFYLFSVRNVHGTSLTRRGVLGTRAVLIGVATVTAAPAAITYWLPLQAIFGSAALAPAEAAVVLTSGRCCSPLGLGEATLAGGGVGEEDTGDAVEGGGGLGRGAGVLAGDEDIDRGAEGSGGGQGLGGVGGESEAVMVGEEEGGHGEPANNPTSGVYSGRMITTARPPPGPGTRGPIRPSRRGATSGPTPTTGGSGTG